MAYQVINTGAAPNDGTGDNARAAFTKINENFAQVDQDVAGAKEAALLAAAAAASAASAAQTTANQGVADAAAAASAASAAASAASGQNTRLTTVEGRYYGSAAQSLTDVTGSRAYDTAYVNTTGRPIHVFIRVDHSAPASAFIRASVGGVLCANDFANGSARPLGINFAVPPGATYTVAHVGATATFWYEYR